MASRENNSGFDETTPVTPSTCCHCVVLFVPVGYLASPNTCTVTQLLKSKPPMPSDTVQVVAVAFSTGKTPQVKVIRVQLQKFIITFLTPEQKGSDHLWQILGRNCLRGPLVILRQGSPITLTGFTASVATH